MRDGMVKIKWRPSGQLGELRKEIAERLERKKQLYIIRDEPASKENTASVLQDEPVVQQPEPAHKRARAKK